MAQLVEQRIRNAWVAGSSPAVGSIEFTGQSLMRLAFLLFLTRIALPKKREYGADIISSASKYRQKVAKRRVLLRENGTCPVPSLSSRQRFWRFTFLAVPFAGL